MARRRSVSGQEGRSWSAAAALTLGLVLASCGGGDPVLRATARPGSIRSGPSGIRDSLRSASGLEASGVPAALTATSVPVPTTVLPTTSTSVAPTLVPWSGPVEHLFFHTLVFRPELAFTADSEGRGFRDYFVTVDEFRAVLDQLYANGWTLVDIHRAVNGTVELPPGRRPLVISEDDVNYYDYSRARGLGWRLALDDVGNVKVEVHDEEGVRLTDDDLIPILDAFVAAHPLFSAHGAKGVLGLTGYEGLLGERVNVRDSVGSVDAIARATAIADRLRATGWTFASHSYGHVHLNALTTAQARNDATRWLAEATPVVGPTDIYIYPFGEHPPLGAATTTMLAELGFTVQCDIDPVPRLTRVGNVTMMSRRHIDGIAFASTSQSLGLAPLFDVSAVVDEAARSGRGRSSASPTSPTVDSRVS